MTNVVITAVRDAHDRLVGFAKVTRDITERKLAEEAREKLQQSRELFAEAGKPEVVVLNAG